jgi:hypothetical protein
MARRPKRITLEIISDSTHKLHKKYCAALVDDLLRKRPRGPDCAIEADAYQSTWNGHTTLKDGENGETCGYSDLILYRLCIALSNDGSEWDWKYYARDRWPELKQAGTTRRGRRLAHRIEPAYRRIRRAGRPGIYSIQFGHSYNAAKIMVYAESAEMAKLVAKTSMGCTFPSKDECNATFEREGCVSELMGLNASPAAKFSRQAVANREEIKKLQKEIEILELRSSMITTYSIAAVAQ